MQAQFCTPAVAPRTVLALSMLLLLHGRPADAQTNIPIVNHSFEADVLQDGFWIDGFLTGWHVFGFTAGPQNWTDAQYPGANDNDALPSTVPDVALDLAAVYRTAYHRGRYAKSIDYSKSNPASA